MQGSVPRTADDLAWLDEKLDDCEEYSGHFVGDEQRVATDVWACASLFNTNMARDLAPVSGNHERTGERS